MSAHKGFSSTPITAILPCNLFPVLLIGNNFTAKFARRTGPGNVWMYGIYVWNDVRYQDVRLYSEGVMPVCLLKYLLKKNWSLK